MGDAVTIACPHCQTPRETTKRGAEKLRCRSCGEYFTPGSVLAAGPGTAPPSATSPSPGPAAGARKVGQVTVAPKGTLKLARRPPATKARPPAKKTAAAPPGPSEPPAVPVPVQRAKEAGRRGGLATYRHLVGR